MAIRQLQPAQTFFVKKVHFTSQKKRPPLRHKFFTLHDDVPDKFRLYLQTKLQNYMYIIHQHILLLFHAYFIQISSYPPLHMNIPYMFFIISIWKCYVVSECIMNTLRKH